MSSLQTVKLYVDTLLELEGKILKPAHSIKRPTNECTIAVMALIHVTYALSGTPLTSYLIQELKSQKSSEKNT